MADNKMRVLLLIEAFDIRNMLRIYLQVQNCQVVIANDYDHAVSLMREYPVDVAIVDAHMMPSPNNSFYSLMKHWNLGQNFQSVIFMTRNDFVWPDELNDFMYEDEDIDFLSMPFDIEELWIRVKKMYSRKQK